MNIGAARIVLRPRTLAEVVDLSLAYCVRQAFGLMFRLSLCTTVPVFMICLALFLWGGWDFDDLWLVVIPALAFFKAPFTVAAGLSLFDANVTTRAVLKHWLGRFFASTMTAGVVALCIWIGYAVLFVPGLMLSALWLHADEAVLLERSGLSVSLSRTGRLIRAGGYGRGVGLVCLILVIYGVSGFCCQALLKAGLLEFLLQLQDPFAQELEEVTSPWFLLGVLLALPLTATASFFNYIDIRTRIEGWDLQLSMQARELEAGASGEQRGGA